MVYFILITHLKSKFLINKKTLSKQGYFSYGGVGEI